MRELIAITDVTEMWASEVCIAGVTQELECVRPVTAGGVQIWDLYEDDNPIIFPGAKVWMDFSPAQIAPPHMEDRTFDPRSVEFKDAFEGQYWETLLKKTSRESVQAIFDGNLKERQVTPGTQTRSLGTIGGVTILDLNVDRRYGNRTVLRIDFKDTSGEFHTRFPVNDLAFRRVYSQLLTHLSDKSDEFDEFDYFRASESLKRKLARANRTYLRIGLARPAKIGDYPETCWVQVTGVYTFPDYLDGRNWSSFR
ncbi:MAG: hypothetical protein F4Z35_02920 [Dehalococcoidia bacterium]|nr:hypothetical protein [Dehalococcoidia bacterium]